MTRGFPLITPSNAKMGGFPQQMKVTLKYVETRSMNPAAGATDWIIYGLNNVYDPYSGAGGHQPSNFDRWSQIYRKFLVYNARVLVQYAPEAAANIVPGYFGFVLDTSANQVGAATDPASLMEQPYAQYSLAGLAAGGLPNGSLRATIPIYSWLGCRNLGELRANPDAVCTSAAGPTTQLYMEVWYAAINGDDPGTASFRIEIEYDVLMSDPLFTVFS